jgi:ABC-type lipoprotein release transport system permease subunit
MGVWDAGVFLFERFLKRVELRKLFLWLSLIGIAAGLTQLILVTGTN